MDKEIERDVKVLWNYLCLNDKESQKVDCIIGLGSILKIVPQKCAELYQQGYSDLIVFSGNCGKGTQGVIKKTEAEIFKDIAVQNGVFENDVLLENNATNTYENFKFIKEVLAANNIDPQSFLIVGKPYQERRAASIAGIELGGKIFFVSSFQITLEDFLNYVNENNLMTTDDVICELVGEININLLAPKYGLQIAEEIPPEVLESYQRLLAKGYTKYVITDDIINNVMKSWETRGLK